MNILHYYNYIQWRKITHLCNTKQKQEKEQILLVKDKHQGNVVQKYKLRINNFLCFTYFIIVSNFVETGSNPYLLLAHTN